MSSVIAVFGASSLGPTDSRFAQAVECGRLLGRAGYSVATGGYGGAMEAVSQGASEEGAGVIGVTAPSCFPDRSGANRFVAEEIAASSMTERIHRIISLADGFIALEGSIGTLTELLVAWNVAYVDRLSGSTPKPVIAVGELWADVVPYLSARAATDRELVTCVATVAEAVDHIRRRVPVS